MTIPATRADLVLVGFDLGPAPTYDAFAAPVDWLGGVVRLARTIGPPQLPLPGPYPDPSDLPSGRFPGTRAGGGFVVVVRAKFENPLEILLGGPLCLLVYKLVIVARDWTTERGQRRAQVRLLDAAADEQELRNRLLATLVRQLEEVGYGPEAQSIAERVLADPEFRGLLDHVPPTVRAEVVDG